MAERAVEKDAGLEWQTAEGSRTLHIIDTTRTAPRRSGPQSLCGKRPQRNNGPWFCLPFAELPKVPPYGLRRCPDCEDTRVTPPAVPRCTCVAGDDLPFPAQHATLCPRFAHPRVTPPSSTAATERGEGR
jgi:hypothetical protein